jgi:hypothetical protein
MFAWLSPLALAGLLAAAGPVAVHLLRRQRADRLPFASLRFVRAASTAAVRFRLPSDMWLLFLRVAIVCGAAVALAQPMFVSPARHAAWNARTSRAIVVDTSTSMSGAAQRADEAARAETTGAVQTIRVDADRLRVGLLRAVEVLTSAPPSRREIVVISDFQRGSLTAADLAIVPAAVGLRFTVAGAPPAVHEFQGDVGIGAPGVEPRLQRIVPTPDGTSARLVSIDVTTEGLRLLNGGAAGESLLRAVARAGAPAGSAGQPLALAFITPNQGTLSDPTNAVQPAGQRPTQTWMLRTLLAMRRDGALIEAARQHKAIDVGPAVGERFVVARDETGTPAVLGEARGPELVLSIAGGPADYLSAAALRSALIARRGQPDWAEHEVGQLPALQLAGWTRAPAPFEMTGWVSGSEMAPGDARWVWLLVLGLLGVETVVRRRRSQAEPAANRESDRSHADAA